jgi:hypothetical protein
MPYRTEISEGLYARGQQQKFAILIAQGAQRRFFNWGQGTSPRDFGRKRLSAGIFRFSLNRGRLYFRSYIVVKGSRDVEAEHLYVDRSWIESRGSE